MSYGAATSPHLPGGVAEDAPAGRPATGFVRFSEAEKATVRAYYLTVSAELFSLDELAGQLPWRDKHSICRCARRMGLTKQNRQPRALAAVAKTKKPKWQDKPHPRGMLGKNHSETAKEAVGRGSRKNWATWKTFGIGPMSEETRQRRSDLMSLWQSTIPASKNLSRTKGGHRADLGGQYFRSAWEANYARYLNLLIKLGAVESWEFEPETFWFHEIKRGVRSYLLDFKVKYKNESKPVYVEVKGWMDVKSKTKISRFQKYYPEHRLEIVDAKAYRTIERKWSSVIPEWERRLQAIRPRKAGA